METLPLWQLALEKASPWVVTVLLLYILWDKERREEKGIREAIRDQVAALQIVAGLLTDAGQKLDSLISCVQLHDARVQGIEQVVKMNAKAIDLASEALDKLENKIDNLRGRTTAR